MSSNCAADKDFILKDLHPFGRGLVGRNDDRSLLMKIVHQAFHGYEQRPVSPHDGITYESGGHESLASPGGAHEYDVVHLVKPYQRPHLLKLGFGDAGTVVEIEVVQVAVLRELGLTHPAQQIILLAGVQLVLQEVVLDKANGTLDTSFTLGISLLGDILFLSDAPHYIVNGPLRYGREGPGSAPLGDPTPVR